MVDNQAMFEKKKALAEKLLKRNVILIYADTSSSIFIVTDCLTSDEVVKLINEEGFELADSPEAGFYATAEMKKNGYWCNLK